MGILKAHLLMGAYILANVMSFNSTQLITAALQVAGLEWCEYDAIKLNFQDQGSFLRQASRCVSLNLNSKIQQLEAIKSVCIQ